MQFQFPEHIVHTMHVVCDYLHVQLEKLQFLFGKITTSTLDQQISKKELMAVNCHEIHLFRINMIVIYSTNLTTPLVKIVACRLVGAKSLSEPMLPRVCPCDVIDVVITADCDVMHTDTIWISMSGPRACDLNLIVKPKHCCTVCVFHINLPFYM